MMEEKRVCSALALVRRSMRELLLLQLAHHIHHAVEAAPGIAIRNSDMTSRLMLSDLPGRPKTSSMSMLRPKTPKSIWATFALGIESGVSLGAPLLFTPSTNSLAARKTWSASFRLPLLCTPGRTERGAAQQSVKVRTRRCCLSAEAQWRVGALHTSCCQAPSYTASRTRAAGFYRPFRPRQRCPARISQGEGGCG